MTTRPVFTSLDGGAALPASIPGQSAPDTPSMIALLAAQGLRNLFIKFKLDLP